MKKKNSVCEFVSSRNEILRRMFLSRVGENGGLVENVFQEMVKMPAPRFYISEERAYLLLLLRRKKSRRIDCGKMVPSRIRMIEEIERRVEELRRRKPRLSFKSAVFEVVNSPAPAFYLTQKTMQTIVYRTMASFRVRSTVNELAS